MSELKTVLALFVLKYDLKLGGDGTRPADMHSGAGIFPPSAPLYLRKRQVVSES